MRSFCNTTLRFAIGLSVACVSCSTALSPASFAAQAQLIERRNSHLGFARLGHRYLAQLRALSKDKKHFSVTPDELTFLDAWTEYEIDTCDGGTPGTWVLGTQPKYGQVSTDTIWGTLSNGQCPGIKFPFGAIYYTWTEVQKGAKSDAFNATWNPQLSGKRAPRDSVEDEFHFTLDGKAAVQVSTASLEKGTVEIELTSDNVSDEGTLIVTLMGSSGEYSVSAHRGAKVGPGTYVVSLERTAIAPDKYSSIKATWNIKASISQTWDLPEKWEVLGNYRHSQYNAPTEASCSGAIKPAWIMTRGTCQFQQTTLRNEFMTQTFINGTGISQSWGLLKTAAAYPKSCVGKYPDGANTSNSFVQVSSLTGTCNVVLKPETAVATFPNPKSGHMYSCNDNILLVQADNSNEARKKALDLCPSCNVGFRGTNGHIDNLAANQSCKAHDVSDLGNFWTANTHVGH